MSAYQRLKIKKSPDGVATITLTKPDRRNAMDELMHAELPAAMNALSEMEDVRVIVLTGIQMVKHFVLVVIWNG